MSPQEAEEEDE